VPDYTIHAGNVLDILPTIPSDSFDGSLSDPPYELGFMGREWDSSGIAFNPTFWAEMFRVIKPGGYVLAFGGTRTWHRLASAIEDAGFEMRDHIMWLYATGFPKSKATLKPGYEPIVLARKPVRRGEQGKFLAIEACRIRPGEVIQGGGANFASWRRAEGREAPEPVPSKPHTLGRWPMNVILDEGAAAQLDAQSGGRGVSRGTAGTGNGSNYSPCYNNNVGDEIGYGDRGGASRFYFCPKASKKERNAGLDSFKLRPSYMVANGSKTAATNGVRHERKTEHRNPHPTVKPIELTKWLASLIKTEDSRRLLVPFSGSGSEIIGALQAGWDEVMGVELSGEYVNVARSRIQFHQQHSGTQAIVEKTQARAGRLGGASRSKAKRLAAKLNGQRGGRPRKVAVA